MKFWSTLCLKRYQQYLVIELLDLLLHLYYLIYHHQQCLTLQLSVVSHHFSSRSNCVVTVTMLLCHSRKELTREIKSPSKNPKFLQMVTNEENWFPLPETNRLYLSPSPDRFKKVLGQNPALSLQTAFKVEMRWETSIDSTSQPHLLVDGSTKAHGE